MQPSDFAAHITEIILGVGSLFVFLAKYKEVLTFMWRVAEWLATPIRYFLKWIKLARKLETEIADNKSGIASGRKEIDDVRQSIVELTSFVKEKLSPNGGNSPVDMIKRIENRQILNEARHNALLDNSRLGIFFCDLHGRNSWVNRTYARFLGCGTQELLGFSWKQFIKTEELARYSKVWQTAFNDGCEFEETVEFTDTHGQRVNLHIVVTAIKNEKGIVSSYIGQLSAL